MLVSYRPLKELVGLDLERKRFTFSELVANRDLGAIAQQAHQKELNELSHEALPHRQRQSL